MSDNNNPAPATPEQYIYTNSNGVKFYLFTRFVSVRGGRRTPVFLFGLSPRPLPTASPVWRSADSPA